MRATDLRLTAEAEGAAASPGGVTRHGRGYDCDACGKTFEGEPAGGGGVYMHEGVAEFGGASTRPVFRRRGVQSALLAARLKAASATGCDTAIVLTEPGSDSERNLGRAGFRLGYTKVIVRSQSRGEIESPRP